MGAYNALYLDEIIETQGILFEYLYEFKDDIDASDFIYHFMKSPLRYYIDHADPYYCTKDYSEWYNMLIKDYQFKPKSTHIKYDWIKLKWIGEFYAYYQWYTSIPSATLVSLHTYDDFSIAYPGLHDLDFKLAAERTLTTENVLGFHDEDKQYGFLSNWYPSSFTDSRGVTFTSVEQYLMYSKALTFNDSGSADKILKTSDPAEIKYLGRMVKNYRDSLWKFVRRDIAIRGIRYKFEQNQSLKEQLLATGKTVLAECAVKDTAWGIGLPTFDERYKNINNWQGDNLLGLCLMYVRDTLH